MKRTTAGSGEPADLERIPKRSVGQRVIDWAITATLYGTLAGVTACLVAGVARVALHNGSPVAVLVAVAGAIVAALGSGLALFLGQFGTFGRLPIPWAVTFGLTTLTASALTPAVTFWFLTGLL